MTSQTQKNTSPRLRHLLELLNFATLIVNPNSSRAQRVYEILATTNPLADKFRYLNLGYWAKAKSFDDACQSLVERLAIQTGVSEGQTVLDVGCGFGDQDRFIVETFHPKKVSALNITRMQLEAAALEHPLPEIDWVLGSATDLPFPRETFDSIIALESAPHFNTREKFFDEALRTLKPGGRVGLADMVVQNKARSFVNQIKDRITGRMWQCPVANVYPIEVYKAKLETAGFVDIKVDDITDEVYPKLSAYVKKRLAEGSILRDFNPIILKSYMSQLADMNQYFTYVIVTAQKPL